MPTRYAIWLSSAAESALYGITSKSEQKRVSYRLDALEVFPEMGTAYDPSYPAARPEDALLVTYTGHHGIYYVIDERARRVCVLHLEDQRRDPERRFD